MFASEIGNRLHEKEQLIQSKLLQVEQKLNQLLNYSLERMASLEPKVIAQHEDVNAVYGILRQLVDEGGGIVRFGWSNADLHLTVSSTRGVHIPPIDLSHRAYIQHARSHLNQTHIAQVLPHISTTAPFKGIYRGLTDDSGNHIGTLAALFYLQPMQAMISDNLATCDCYYTVLAPDDERLAHADHPSALNMALSKQSEPTPTDPSQWAFKVSGQMKPDVRATLIQDNILASLSIVLLLNATLITLFYHIRRRYISPVESAVQELSPYMDHQLIDENATLEIKLKNLKQLAYSWQHQQNRLKEQEGIIHDCMEALTHLHTQQERFLLASSQEMQRMYDSVCDYANHIEDMIMNQQIHPDAAFDFDDVREMGANLKHLSDCFQRFSHGQKTKTELVDPCQMIRDNLRQMQDAIERRNMRIDIESAREVWLTLRDGSALLDATIRSVLFACIRHAEDESLLDVQFHTEGEKVMIICSVNRFRQSLLGVEQQDFSMFVPSLQRDMQTAIKETVLQHANLLVAQSFMTQIHGVLAVDTSETMPAFRITLMLHSQNDLATQ